MVSSCHSRGGGNPGSLDWLPARARERGRNDIKDRNSLIAIKKSFPPAEDTARSAAIQIVQAVQNVQIVSEPAGTVKRVINRYKSKKGGRDLRLRLGF